MNRILTIISAVSLAMSLAHAEPTITASPEAGIRGKTKSVTFTAIGLGQTTGELTNGWTITWTIMKDGTQVESAVTNNVVCQWAPPDSGGLFSVGVELKNPSGEVRAQAALNYGMIDLDVPIAPLTVTQQDDDGHYWAGYGAVGVPGGGEYAWVKNYGPGDVEFCEAESANPIVTFHAAGTYEIQVTYSYNPQDVVPVGPIVVGQASGGGGGGGGGNPSVSFDRTPVYVPLGGNSLVTVNLTDVAWNDVNFVSTDTTKATAQKDGANKVKITGLVGTDATGIQLNAEKQGAVIGTTKIVVVGLTDLQVTRCTKLGTTSTWYVAQGLSGHDCVVTALFDPSIPLDSVPSGFVSWSGSGVTGPKPSQRTVNIDQVGTSNVSASCGTGNKSVSIKVVEISDLQITGATRVGDDAWIGRWSATTSAQAGQDVSIKAILNPTVSPFPADLLTWSVNGNAVTVTNDTYKLSRQNAGTFLVTAVCGNSQAREKIDIVGNLLICPSNPYIVVNQHAYLKAKWNDQGTVKYVTNQATWTYSGTLGTWALTPHKLTAKGNEGQESDTIEVTYGGVTAKTGLRVQKPSGISVVSGPNLASLRPPYDGRHANIMYQIMDGGAGGTPKPILRWTSTVIVQEKVTEIERKYDGTAVQIPTVLIRDWGDSIFYASYGQFTDYYTCWVEPSLYQNTFLVKWRQLLRVKLGTTYYNLFTNPNTGGTVITFTKSNTTVTP